MQDSDQPHLRNPLEHVSPSVWGVIPPPSPEMKKPKTYEGFKRQLKTCRPKLNAIQFDKGQVAKRFMDSYYGYF